MTARSYRSKMRLSIWLAVAAAAGAGIVAGRVARIGQPGENFWLVYPALLAVMALAFAGTLPWWRKLDDMQKQGHLVSWYWGGLAGGLAAMLGLVAAYGVDSAISQGSLITVMGQAVGFLVAWAIWSARRRGPAE
jgi:hypothetical protein